jgi:hypothetical protein
MKRLTFALSFCIWSYANPAFAAFYSGNKLNEWCQSTSSPLDNLQCQIYIAAIYDNSNDYAQMSGKSLFCIPSGVTLGQLVDVVKLWLTNNPSKRHFTASWVVTTAFIDAFPCKTK